MAKHPIPEVLRFVPALADEFELGLIPHVAAFQVNLRTAALSLYRLAAGASVERGPEIGETPLSEAPRPC